MESTRGRTTGPPTKARERFTKLSTWRQHAVNDQSAVQREFEQVRSYSFALREGDRIARITEPTAVSGTA